MLVGDLSEFTLRTIIEYVHTDREGLGETTALNRYGTPAL